MTDHDVEIDILNLSQGYRSLRKELSQVRQELDQQRKQRNSEIRNSKTIQTKFYKSVVGTR